jgi:predicted transport protein
VGDIKLFRVAADGVAQLEGKSVVIEKTLQTLMEKHLEAFLGVRLLASEHSTGRVHGGRIDSLGIDENNSPVIIEYKRSLNENVINQGLFYLDWLLDHRAEFQLLAMTKVGADIKTKINWSGTRLICIAADFTRYDEHAVTQIGRNIELLRYKSYGPELLLLELVNSTAGFAPAGDGEPKVASTARTALETIEQSPPELVDLYHQLEAFLMALGDVQVNPTKTYVAYRRIKNFACVVLVPKFKGIVVWVKVDPKSLVLDPTWMRDVSEIGHAGTGDLELSLHTPEDLERAKALLVTSYEAS